MISFLLKNVLTPRCAYENQANADLSVDIPRLSKTLSDETRLRILRFLKQRGPTSYVDLMGALEITNTGRLNYHLKMLGDLITKDDPDGFMG